jgi:hypothetical protein
MKRYAEFMTEVGRAIMKHPEWRYGQTVFNVMHSMHPELADKFRGTSVDPFYKDEMAEAFVSACLEEWHGDLAKHQG